MPFMSDEIREETTKFLGEVKNAIRMVVFTQEMECQYCAENRQLAEEIASLSDQIELEVYDFEADQELAQELGIDKIPAIAVIGEQDYGIRFYGIPAGYEFTSLIHAVRSVGTGQTELSEEATQALAEIDQPVHLQVFVTPTCPYCPQSVVLAHQMAMANPLIRSDMVEATEFPQLAIKYQVMGVPRTVINEMVHIEGAVNEPMLMSKLQESLAAAEG